MTGLCGKFMVVNMSSLGKFWSFCYLCSVIPSFLYALKIWSYSTNNFLSLGKSLFNELTLPTDRLKLSGKFFTFGFKGNFVKGNFHWRFSRLMALLKPQQQQFLQHDFLQKALPLPTLKSFTSYTPKYSQLTFPLESR